MDSPEAMIAIKVANKSRAEYCIIIENFSNLVLRSVRLVIRLANLTDIFNNNNDILARISVRRVFGTGIFGGAKPEIRFGSNLFELNSLAKQGNYITNIS